MSNAHLEHYSKCYPKTTFDATPKNQDDLKVNASDLRFIRTWSADSILTAGDEDFFYCKCRMSDRGPYPINTKDTSWQLWNCKLTTYSCERTACLCIWTGDIMLIMIVMMIMMLACGRGNNKPPTSRLVRNAQTYLKLSDCGSSQCCSMPIVIYNYSTVNYNYRQDV